MGWREVGTVGRTEKKEKKEGERTENDSIEKEVHPRLALLRPYIFFLFVCRMIFMESIRDRKAKNNAPHSNKRQGI